MEFFSDRWLLWTCFFAPAVLWLYAGRAPRRRLPLSWLASLVAVVSGGLLVLGAVHASVDLLFDLARLFRR